MARSSQPTPVVEAPSVAAPEPVRVLVPSPLGPLGIEFVGPAVSRLGFAPKAGERRRFTPLGKLRLPQLEPLDEIVGRLSEYFAGARRGLDIELDLGRSGVDGFNRRVLRETCKIPFGRTRTYHQIAEAAGRPEAYRQVLAAVMANPIPIVIPCHRVVPSRAGTGGYVGGTRRKQWLLKLEAQVAGAPG